MRKTDAESREIHLAKKKHSSHAGGLQTKKSEMTASNTVIRHFLEASLESFQLGASDSGNNKQEPFELVLPKIRKL